MRTLIKLTLAIAVLAVPLTALADPPSPATQTPVMVGCSGCAHCNLKPAQPTPPANPDDHPLWP